MTKQQRKAGRRRRARAERDEWRPESPPPWGTAGGKGNAPICFSIDFLLCALCSGWFCQWRQIGIPAKMDCEQGNTKAGEVAHVACFSWSSDQQLVGFGTPKQRLFFKRSFHLGKVILSSCEFYIYDSWPIPRPRKQATSLVFPGRRIGRVCGMDRSSNSFFLMVLPFSKNYSLILWIFTYEPLKFWENFVSHPSLFKKHPSNFVKKFRKSRWAPKLSEKLCLQPTLCKN